MTDARSMRGAGGTIDRARVGRLLARLAEADTDLEEAEVVLAQLDACAAAALPWVYRRLHDARGEADVHASALVLARWLHGPLADPIEKALRSLLGEPRVGDLAKIAAAALLERQGRPVRDDELRAALADPARMGRQALRAALAAAGRPAARARLLEAVGRLERSARVALADDLMALGLPGAGLILGALCHSADPDVAVAAVAATDVLRLDECWPLVSIAAREHPDPYARRQAARTAGRLEPRWPRRAWPRVLVLEGRTSAGPTGILALAVHARDHAGAGWDVLSVVCDENVGLRDYAVAERLSETERQQVLDRFALGGLALGPVTGDRGRDVLGAAAGRALAIGAPVGPGWLGWPELLGDPGAGPADA